MISICILNMNRLNTLKRTFSILNELDIENEILVFDQNSTDGSVEFLNKQKNVKLFLSDKNVGNSISRNKMIQSCKYDYILLLDSDIVPIYKSVESLYLFMIENPQYSFVGYDYESCSNIENKITEVELGIRQEDVVSGIRIALTQYGMFRKKDLLECPFPEFEPFNKEGWGAEDDLVGMTIHDNNIGLTGKIKGRVYYHDYQKSSWQFIDDEVERLYALRYIVYKYFDLFLTPIQKKQSLQSKELPTVKLDLAKYHWEDGYNFGDIATDWVWNKYFPFFELTVDSENLLFFGGSIIEHYPNAKRKYNREFKKIIMFGVGVWSDSYMLPSIEFELYPRGFETGKSLRRNGLKTKKTVGDVLQLLSLLPYKQSRKTSILSIQDVFKKIETPKTENIVRVSQHNPWFEHPAPYVNLSDFLESVSDYSGIVSSQIHPFLYYVSSGKSATLIEKDLRAKDLLYFSNLRFDSDDTASMNCRKQMHNNIPKMIDTLFSILHIFINKKG